VIAFLCSERASYVLGCAWQVDGGRHGGDLKPPHRRWAKAPRHQRIGTGVTPPCAPNDARRVGTADGRRKRAGPLCPPYYSEADRTFRY